MDSLQDADALYLSGRPREARELYQRAMALHPQDATLAYRIALCAWAEGNIDLAQASFEAAIRLDPANAAAHEGLGQLHLESGRFPPADLHSARALELAPGDMDFAVSRAFVLESNRQTDAAWEILRRFLDQGKATVRMAVLFSRLAPRLKQENRALDLLGRLLDSKSFANSREERGLRYAAAALLDSMGRYDQAFHQARLAGKLRQAHYDPRHQEQDIDRQIAYFTPAKLASLPRPALNSQKLVFIVGMPRSGTSLVEQILASHPAIHGGGELPWLPRLIDTLPGILGGPFPDCLDDLTPDRANELAARYLDPVLALAPHAARITDKLPLNSLYLGLIAILFPQARIVHCTRDPRDTCLSCFMTDFATFHEFSFDLAHTTHFHREHDRLLAHWKTALPLPIFEINYERLVEHPEPQIRQLLEFVGVDWDSRCLNFHENKRFVGTASNIQIRQPMYRSSIGRWRNYAEKR